ncbi:hypothetical protein PZ938_02390 [Luteipulveratus sp. YIM 133132]|uniref:hypothetical protein n=1 Tax=Luteipulveratus flavus TaxID=3031728 RepID=UPI0023AFCEEA|nr:hypothetical protein [Luteipulveratus sp. YIM 133132]MDE9364443.1 hypothetical protein [Luteipulveratus sp. YIM 133132]
MPNDDPKPDPIDLTRAPLGELAAAALVRAVGALGDLAERHYLELKGPTDLASKVNKQKVAKFILGAANRLPAKAGEAFEGYGVMVIGITDEGIVGIPPIEMLELSKVVEPFLGASGPHWDIIRVPVSGSDNEVLVVVVDPPKDGESPFVCRANGDGLQSGRIYYRGDGATREPTADEMDLLLARGAVRPSAPVGLQVALTQWIVPLIVDNEKTLEEFMDRVRAQLMAPVPAPKTPTAGSIAIAGSSANSILASALAGINSQGDLLASMRAEQPETRSVEEYVEAIDQWTAEVREWWPGGVANFVSYMLAPCEIRIANETQTFLEDVELKIHLEGKVEALEYHRHGDRKVTWYDDLEMPRPPRKWGPINRDLGLYSSSAFHAAQYARSANMTPMIPRFSKSSWKNSGSVTIQVDVGDLRPRATFESDDEESVLILRGEASETVHGTWQATVRGYDEVFTGELSVEVAKPGLLTELLRQQLRVPGV